MPSERLGAAIGLGRRCPSSNVLAGLPRDLRSPSICLGCPLHRRWLCGAGERYLWSLRVLPIPLRLVGEVAMAKGRKCRWAPASVSGSQPAACAPNADGVVMLEYAQELGDGFVEIMRASAGENRLQADEDLCQGDLLIPKGWTLAPPDLGLGRVGLQEVPVIKRPLVGILSTGDEIFPESQPGPGQVRDINAYAWPRVLAKGGQIRLGGIVPDDYGRLRRKCQARWACQIVLISGAAPSAPGTTPGT